jgi:hypothetical protein
MRQYKMKLIITVTTAVIFLIFMTCTEFSTSYQSIDEGEFRMLNFMFSPADIAPGDSATLIAVFAGKKKDLRNDIDWRVSFNVAVNNYGMETAVGSDPIDKHGRLVNRTFSKNTQTIAFRFKIPENIVRKSASIPENWTDMLPPYIRSALPKEFTSTTKNQMIDFIEKRLEDIGNGDYVYEDYMHDIRLLPALLQFFTVPIIITANVKNEGRQHKIQCSHSVRYNRHFNHYLGDYIPVNRNPRIDSVLVHKVKGDNIMRFDNPGGKQYTSFNLDFSDTTEIIIEDGYSYFLEWYSNPFDQTLTMDAALLAAAPHLGSTYVTKEKHYAYWQFQMDKNEKKNVPFNKQMDIDNVLGRNSRLIVPKDKSIKNVTLWATVRDEVINEKLRPRGSTLGEYQVRFVYK